MSLEERKAEAKKRVQRIIDLRKDTITLDMVKANTRQPEPYRHPSKMTVTEVVKLCLSQMQSVRLFALLL